VTFYDAPEMNDSALKVLGDPSSASTRATVSIFRCIMTHRALDDAPDAAAFMLVGAVRGAVGDILLIQFSGVTDVR